MSSKQPRLGRSRPPAGEPSLWLTGGALVAALAMIITLVGFVVVQGASTFWPGPVREVTLLDGRTFLGEPAGQEVYRPRQEDLSQLSAPLRQAAESELSLNGGFLRRSLLRTANFELSPTQVSYTWIPEFSVKHESAPEWALVLERVSNGRFIGLPKAFLLNGQAIAEGPADVWEMFQKEHATRRAQRLRIESIREHDIGGLARRIQDARLAAVRARLAHGEDAPQHQEALNHAEAVKAKAAKLRAEHIAKIETLERENAQFVLRMATADGQTKDIALDEIVRAYPANRLTTMQRFTIYVGRWWEFLSGDPRNANSEGGVFPAIWGTIALTLIMSLAVVPFGVLAALYLREYAKPGLILSLVRIAINNLAGVPSVVFGVFGLGLFCYIMGGWVDRTFYPAELADSNSPVFGKGGLIWASLTLALLTLPVVIIATEEALAAVPNSMREGSYACGASKWQTIRRIVLPRAMPGILTGLILAVARAAGEVAPLMLVGAVKLAPDLPVDDVFPFVHPQRSFMHLGFHIFDLGFQSRDAEAAKPMVYTTTLLLIGLVLSLNLLAVWLRARFRRPSTGPF